MHLRCIRSFSPFLCRVCRLEDNRLGPDGGKAFAEALKSNTTLKKLNVREGLFGCPLGDDAEQALRAAARSGLELLLYSSG